MDKLREWKNKIYKRVIIGIACAGVVIALFVLHFNSYALVLRLNGITETKVLSVYNEYRTIFCINDGGRVFLARRNRLGFWFVSEKLTRSGTGGILYAWIDTDHSVSYFDRMRGSPRLNLTNNIFYFNTNAVRQIEINIEDLPLGVALNIWQSRQSYWLHFVTFHNRFYIPDSVHSLDFIYELIGGFTAAP
jgi:hypothetical protein